MQAHERVQEGPRGTLNLRAPLREPRHAVPRLHRRNLLFAAAQAIGQHLEVRHHASRVRLGHLAIDPRGCNRRGARLRERARTRVQSRPARLPEREPAVVPDDGAEKVVPGHRRARRGRRRRSQASRAPARPGTAASAASTSSAADRDSTPCSHSQMASRNARATAPEPPASRAPRPPAPTRAVWRYSPPARGTASASGAVPNRVLVLAHRAQTLALGDVHVDPDF